MNGVSLLVALATLGVDVGWEAGPDGQLHYTVRIEKVLLDPLRQGEQAIVSSVDAPDRNLRRFQIMLTDTDARRAPNRAAGTPEDSVKYGWRPSPGDGGGVDYLVQISPERIEGLASGLPIRGLIASGVSDVRRIYIFAGVGELPRQLPERNTSPPPEPPQFIRDPADQPARDPGSGSLATPRNVSPRFGDPQFRSPSAEQPASSGGRTLDPRDSNFANGQRRDGDSNWQHTGNQWLNNDHQYATGGNRTDNSYSQPWYRDQNGNLQGPHNDPSRGTLPPQTQPPQTQLPQTQAPQTFPHNYAQQMPQQQPAAQQTYAGGPLAGANPTLPQQQAAPAWPANVVAQQQPMMPTAATTVAAAPVTQTAAAVPGPAVAQPPVDGQVRPWTPLILTTMALFTSLGANAYLGWLAWSFFWRFRDAASDVVRARSQTGATRQAA